VTAAVALAARAAPATARRSRRHLAPGASLALVSLVPVVGLAVVMVLVASLIGPFIMFAIPLMLLFGCAIGPLVALVRGDLR
jgi:hypothetical protein